MCVWVWGVCVVWRGAVGQATQGEAEMELALWLGARHQVAWVCWVVGGVRTATSCRAWQLQPLLCIGTTGGGLWK